MSALYGLVRWLGPAVAALPMRLHAEVTERFLAAMKLCSILPDVVLSTGAIRPDIVRG